MWDKLPRDRSFQISFVQDVQGNGRNWTKTQDFSMTGSFSGLQQAVPMEAAGCRHAVVQMQAVGMRLAQLQAVGMPLAQLQAVGMH